MLFSWCMLVTCVGAVLAAPSNVGLSKSVHVTGVQAEEPQQHHHQPHTIDPHFRNSEFYKAMDQAGANLFHGLGNAATALGGFLARLAGGGGQPHHNPAVSSTYTKQVAVH